MKRLKILLSSLWKTMATTVRFVPFISVC